MAEQKATSTDNQAKPEETAAPVLSGDNMSFSTDHAGRVMLGPDIEIYPDKPRPDLASFGTQAFEAQDRRQVGRQLAILSGRHLVPRITMIGSYKNLGSPSVLHLSEAGVVYWPPDGKQYFACIFEMPPARRLLEKDGHVHALSEDRLIPALIKPMISALQSFKLADMVHGGICADNIFMMGAEGAETALLGDGISSAEYLRLDAGYETIERGMAQRAGRGPGSNKNDAYSLGVCIATAIRRVYPFAGKTSDEIIREKLEMGSYAAVMGRERVSMNVAELLRGLLNDDEAQRWDVDEAVRWLEGRSGTGRQPPIVLKAARPFVFREEKMWDVRTTAFAFSNNTAEAKAVIESDQFALWVKRNFEDDMLAKRLEKEMTREENASSERRIAGVCMALDPQAPIRYKELALFPLGFGTALAEAMANDEDTQSYFDLVQLQLANAWLTNMVREITDANNTIALFEKCRAFMMQKMAAQGIERVMYMLNKEAVCMSPALRNYFVATPGQLLRALENMSDSKTRPDNILDRHMMAFISIREPKMIDPHLGHIISRDRPYQVIGIARTLAFIQKRYGVPSVPGVGRWLLSLIGPVIERFNDRDLRQELAKRLEKLPDPGNLTAILDLVDSTVLAQEDTQKFIIARQEFSLLMQERELIQRKLKKRTEYESNTGAEVAMLISVVLATCGILGFLLLYFTNR